MGNTQTPFLGMLADDLVTGIHNMTWDEYRAVARMNPSTIVYGMESRRHLLYAATHGGIEPTNEMRIGTGIHALTLEPETFDDAFVIIPPFHLDAGNVTKDGKQSKSTATTYCTERTKEFLAAADAEGKTVLTTDQYNRARGAVRALQQNPRAAKLVAESQPEMTVTGFIEGVRFKGRIDLLGAILGDIKTTVSCNPWKFSRQFRDLRYLHKLATYRELVEQSTGLVLPVEVIAQEKREPYDSVVFTVPSDRLDAAMVEVRAVVRDYLLAIETGFWPGRDGGQESIELLDLAFGHSAKSDEGDEGVDWDNDVTDESDLASGDLL